MKGVIDLAEMVGKGARPRRMTVFLFSRYGDTMNHIFEGSSRPFCIQNKICLWIGVYLFDVILHQLRLRAKLDFLPAQFLRPCAVVTEVDICGNVLSAWVEIDLSSF